MRRLVDELNATAVQVSRAAADRGRVALVDVPNHANVGGDSAATSVHWRREAIGRAPYSTFFVIGRIMRTVRRLERSLRGRAWLLTCGQRGYDWRPIAVW